MLYILAFPSLKEDILPFHSRVESGFNHLNKFDNDSTSYAHFISTARYLRVSLLMVLQNFSQLDAAYGSDDAETIRANANTHLLLPGAGLRECQYYSERIGNATVPTWTRSRKPGAWTGLADTWTESEAQRRLLTPEEIRTMPPRSVLLLRSTLPPMVLTATPYYEDRSLSQLANIPYEVAHVRPEPLAPQIVDWQQELEANIAEPITPTIPEKTSLFLD